MTQSWIGEFEEDEYGQFRRTSGRTSNTKKSYKEYSDSSNFSDSQSAQGFSESSDDDDDFYGESKKKSKKRQNVAKNTSNGSPTRKTKKRSNSTFFDDDAYEEPGPRKRKKTRYADYSYSDYDDDGPKPWESDSDDDTFSSKSRSRQSTSMVFPEEEEGNSDSSEYSDMVVTKPEEPKGPRIERFIGIPATWDGRTDPTIFFIKIAGESYKHCHWANLDEINSFYNGPILLKKYLRNIKDPRNQPLKECDEPEMKMLQKEQYTQDFLDVERVIAENDEGKYLVVWKGLDYNEATWENEEDIDDTNAMESFRQRNNYDLVRDLPPPPIPDPSQYKPFGDDYPLPNFPNGLELRDYQIEGINWLRQCWYNHRNAILADEMGLGKTVQGVNIIYDLYRNGNRGPFLVVAPLSTLDQWVREFRNWTPLNVVKFTGPGKDVIAKYELYYPDTEVTKFNVILTNPDVLIQSETIFKPIVWHYVIVDEAHELKNYQTKRYEFIESMRIQYLLLMTGTPIQNNMSELWALMHLLDPRKFNNLELFLEKYSPKEDANSNSEAISELQELIRPYMLRRKKNDVEHSIGKKEETIVNVELTRVQKMLYRTLIEQKIPEMKAQSKGVKALPAQKNLAMQLRKACCHPFLIEDYQSIIGDIIKDWSEIDQLVKSSGKMVFLDKLLEKLKKADQKVLIFSQFKIVLDLIGRFLDYRGYTYERIDGSSHGNDRQKKMDRFNDPNEDLFVFLLSTRAGGLGLNLTAASTVIIYDSDWNPQNDVQAQARCHRIGQKAEKVVVYRLITRGTYESEMFDRASKKLGLNQAVLDSSNLGEENMKKEELDLLLAKGAYYQLKDDNYDECDNFQNQTIDEILDSRTRTVYNSNADANSSFSKTTFIANEKDAQLDLNAKDFWKTITSSYSLPTESYSGDYLGKRKRKQRNWGDDSDFDESIWTSSSLSKCITGLRTYGFHHWGRIQQITNVDSREQVITGCTALIQKIFEQKPDDLIFVNGGNLILSDEAKRLQKTTEFRSKEIQDRLKSPDKLIHAIKQLRCIEIFENSSDPELIEVKSSSDWDSKNDASLLHSIWANGLGKWEDILSDQKYFPPDFFNDEHKKAASKRLKKLLEQIEKKAKSSPSEVKEKEGKKHRESKSSDRKSRAPDDKSTPGSSPIEKLAIILKISGLPTEQIRNSIAEATGIEADKVESEAKRIYKACLRLINNKEIKSHDKDIKAFMTPKLAKMLDERRRWLKDFKHFNKHTFKEQKGNLKKINKQNEPPFWVFEKHDPPLFKFISSHGFYKLPNLKEKSPFKDLNPTDQRIFNDTYIKNISNLVKHIEYVRTKLNQFKGDSSDKVIKVDPQDKEFLLPAVRGNTVISSLGNGVFFVFKNYLCRCGFTSTYRYNGQQIQCQITFEKKFKANNHVGNSPEEVLTACGVKTKSYNDAFGISKTFVRYQNQKLLGAGSVEGYTPLLFKIHK